MRKTASASVLAMILCAACLLPSIVVADAGPDSGTEKDPAENALPTNVLTAEELLYGILTLGGLESPDLMFCYNDNDFSERFESFYHRDVPSVGDMAFAVSSGMSADEIAVIVPGSGCGEDEITDMLRSHIEEEEDVYELYSPTDAANLQNAYIGEEGGFIVLIISADQSGILDVLRSCLRSPDKLPAPPSRDTDVTAGTDEPETTDKPVRAGSPERPG